MRQTKGNDYYITLTESTRRFNGEGYNRHKIFLYKEDFNRFIKGLQDAVDHVKTDLMPDFDYELYEKRQEEWEAQMKAEQETGESSSVQSDSKKDSSESPETEEESSDSAETEGDISW